MPTTDNSSSEREQTDESLRAERDRADHEKLAAIDETADAVIIRARLRADEVLAAARAKTDRQPAEPVLCAQSARVNEVKRRREDRALQAERANADAIVRDERAEHAALLSMEREETDKDLSHERARSDDAITARDEILGVVSHDLRNILGGMIGFAELIAREVSEANHVETVRRHAQRILRSGARMNRLIGDLVDFASIEAGSLAVTLAAGDPHQVVTEAADTFQAQARASGVSLDVEFGAGLSLAAFDSARILQVLTNLLSNAIKFTPTGGKVVVHVERTGDELCFAVEDTGVGIPPDKLEAVFLPFVQVAKNDRRGMGLGLYICECIVQGHGGRIWVESKPAEGSTFYFTLPVQVTPLATAGPSL